MTTESAPREAGPKCPGCGSSGVRAVPEIYDDHAAGRAGLADRLARAPGAPTRFDCGLHVVEGMVMAGIGVALAHHGITRDKPLHAVGGSLLALLLFVGTLLVVRGEVRQRAVVAAGEHRAEALWRPSYHCSSCASVFCPDGTPWQGLLTPEQFKKYVWTEAGYGEQLEERFKDVDLPPVAPAVPGGGRDHA
ncbi:hypothetical protein [Streptomyces nodosus]|uniref:hypothetical protein n=1 Tax=Streptomyces nodosus TaxID=40318 RepID=UPI00382E4751